MKRCEYYTWPCCMDGNQCPEPAIASLTLLESTNPKNSLSSKTFWYCAEHYDWLAKRSLDSANDPEHPFRESHEEFCVLNGLKN